MSNLSGNTTSATVTVPLLGAYYVYTGVGLGGMITNVFILAVLISDRKFLSQSSNMAGIAISHFLCALTLASTGLFRVLNTSILNQMASAWSCVERIYPVLYPFAFQSMGLMLIIVGLERFSVFMFPHWYRATWTNGRSWRMVGIVYSYVTVSCCVGLFIAWHQPETNQSCFYVNIFSVAYMTYSSFISATGGTVAAVFTIIRLIRGTTRARSLPLLSGEAGRYRRQLKLTRSMLSVAVCDVCLVVVPSVAYMVSIIDNRMAQITFGVGLATYMSIAYCVNSLMTLAPYLAFNKQFRSKAMQLELLVQRDIRQSEQYRYVQLWILMSEMLL